MSNKLDGLGRPHLAGVTKERPNNRGIEGMAGPYAGCF